MPRLKYSGSEISTSSLGNLSRTSSEQDVIQIDSLQWKEDWQHLENLCRSYQERIASLEDEIQALVTAETSQSSILSQYKARNADWKGRGCMQREHKLPRLLEERLFTIAIHLFEGEVLRLRQELERTVHHLEQLPQTVEAADRLITQELQRIRLLDTVMPTFQFPGNAVAFEAIIKGYSTVEDVEYVKELCLILQTGNWEQLFTKFFRAVVLFRDHQSIELQRRDRELDPSWYKEPWYYTYVQYFGTKDNNRSTFDDLIEMLPYLESLGFRNLYLLPHYESPLADGGYDVSSYRARKNLGGQEAYLRFMKVAILKGFRVATDAILNHTSVEHSWFRRARRGDKRYLDYYLIRNGRKKIGEVERNGDIICRYEDPDKTISERVCIFPDVDRTHGLLVTQNKDTVVQFYRSFYPFQVDLDLRNVSVLDEIFHILGEEVNQGILGKRMDAIPYWIKKPGTSGDSLKETHVLHSLLKTYLKHLSSRVVIIPEVVKSASSAASFIGKEMQLLGQPCSSEGDLLLAFEMQAQLREMNYLQTVVPFWKLFFQLPRLPSNAEWLNLLEHHDETYLSFFSDQVRPFIASYIEEHGGVVYKNQTSAGCRYADCLNHHVERLATAIFTLYMCPGVPLIYYGLEIGWGNNPSHATFAQHWQQEIFKKFELHMSEEKCFDPRELQRGPIPKTKFEEAMNEKIPTIELIRRLNYLRRQRNSLSATAQIHPVDSGHICLFSMIRVAIDDEPLLCVANLSNNQMCLTIPNWQLKQYLSIDEMTHIAMTDLLTEQNVVLIKQKEDPHYLLDLPPFSRAILNKYIR
ncbi:maltose alpha-D-glucosyltransferase [Galdieria sulphuraria]|uniref:Maltose alpha-D-glucosyltransferase n=1 Tax=Galdieria sulphuraria TaxID=130081 RepID=M2W6K8_GALSU|nr:maltose alpha-D-glucosyltransferase [Galdieria sulphuraria]EME31391.1 maltose alpha-D-glucosyltransferase [Galdieria sulphuraria]|eukprot:XP_005707911.1 maltose alpha-D-glucosyltransferase [Galdieria sulphuraria]